MTRLENLATKLEPGLVRAFIAGIQNLKDEVSLSRIIRYLEAGRIDEALDFLTDNLVQQGYRELTGRIQEAFTAGAVASMEFVPRQLGISFDIVNPRTADFLRRYKYNLIQQITRDTRDVLRQVIAASTIAGQNPLTTARLIRSSIGLTVSQVQAVENYRLSLENLNPNALGRALRDARFDSTLRTAVREHKPLPKERIETMVERYRSRYLTYRANTISRTEAIRAVNAGNRDLWKQAVDEGRLDPNQVRRFWVPTYDEKLRESHRVIPEMNPDGVGLDEPFQSPLGPIMFPGDPGADASNTINCRCTVFTRIVT